jgi:HK97 family phage major capsid protein
MPTPKELREKRASLIAEARKLVDDHGDKDGNLPADRQAAFDRGMDEADKIKVQYETLERLMQAEAGMKLPTGGAQPDPEDKAGGERKVPKISIRSNKRTKTGELVYAEQPAGARGTAEYQNSFSHYLRHGAKGLSAEQFAALQSDDAEQAGYLVASEQFAAELLKEVDDLLFIRQHARIHTVPEADSLGIRKRTSRMNTFDWSSELAVSTEDTSLKFGKKILTPHHLTGQIKVSRDLVRRSVMSVDSIVREEMARDAGEAMEDGYLLGDGAQKPLGVFVASDDGISTARDVITGSQTSILADNLINAKYTLKAQYRNASPRWLFHRDAVKIIRKLRTDEGGAGTGDYLWQPGLQAMEPDMLLGSPIDESERVPNTFTNGLYVGLLATWRYYEIADALDMEIQVLTELYAQTNQIGYIGRLKTDGMPTLEEAFVRLKTGT